MGVLVHLSYGIPIAFTTPVGSTVTLKVLVGTLQMTITFGVFMNTNLISVYQNPQLKLVIEKHYIAKYIM